MISIYEYSLICERKGYVRMMFLLHGNNYQLRIRFAIRVTFVDEKIHL